MAKSIRKRWYVYRSKRRLSPLHSLCGYWKCGFESPPVRIFRISQGYRISFEYPLGAVTIPIRYKQGIIEANLFGCMEIAYDGINDRLLIAEEGTYFRDEDREQ
jgi:hypothetical protein